MSTFLLIGLKLAPENKMGKALKLVNKLKRRKKALSMDRNGFDRRDKQDQMEERMSYKALALDRKIQRRLDRNFGINMVADEPHLAKRILGDLERFDFGSSDFGMKLTISAAAMTKIGPRPGDIVKILKGEAKGKYLRVVSIESATELRLEDIATYVGPETGMPVRLQLSDVKKSYK